MTVTGPRIGSLFSGYAGLDLGVQAVLGGTVAWHSDNDPGASAILAHHWPDVPNLGDITQIDWGTVEPVDIITGGFPCQDVSHAGMQAGLRPATRTGLWSQMAYAIDQIRPRLVIAENVRGLLDARAHSDVEPCPWCVGDEPDGVLRALGAVLGDLADLGYDADWCGLRAADVGAPHGRFRVFVIAWPAADAERAVGGLIEPRRVSSGASQGTQLEEERRTGRGRGPHPRPHPAAADAQGAGSQGRDPAVVAPAATERATTWPERRITRGHSDAATPDAEPGQAWGAYEPTIRRWEGILGRLAPAPTETSAKGGQRLSPVFVEWLMGLPAGHVTDVPRLTRNEQLKALGNGVVPQQAAAAVRFLLADATPAAVTPIRRAVPATPGGVAAAHADGTGSFFEALG